MMHGLQGRVKYWQHGPSVNYINRVAIQQRLLVKFSCDPYIDSLLKALLPCVIIGLCIQQLPQQLSSTFLCVLLLVYHNITGLYSFSIFFGIYTFLSFNTRSLLIFYSSPLRFLIPTFFISSTTLTISLSFSLALFIFFYQHCFQSFHYYFYYFSNLLFFNQLLIFITIFKFYFPIYSPA